MFRSWISTASGARITASATRKDVVCRRRREWSPHPFVSLSACVQRYYPLVNRGLSRFPNATDSVIHRAFLNRWSVLTCPSKTVGVDPQRAPVEGNGRSLAEERLFRREPYKNAQWIPNGPFKVIRRILAEVKTASATRSIRATVM